MKKIILLAITALFISCHTQNNLNLNYKWKLAEMNGKNLTNDSANVTLEFDSTLMKVGGNGGCNQYYGECKLNGNTLEVVNLGSTKMFCVETANLESEYFNTLKGKSEIKISDNQLIFTRDGKSVLVFQK